MHFGEYIKDLRAKKRLGLREFCLDLNIDPSFWSKVERGLTNPPRDEEVLATIAKRLGVKHNSQDWVRLTDLAALGRGRIPADLLEDEDVVSKLPLVFRTLRGERPTEAELQQIRDLLKHS